MTMMFLMVAQMMGRQMEAPALAAAHQVMVLRLAPLVAKMMAAAQPLLVDLALVK